jgi:hypothetical protein
MTETLAVTVIRIAKQYPFYVKNSVAWREFDEMLDWCRENIAKDDFWASFWDGFRFRHEADAALFALTWA